MRWKRILPWRTLKIQGGGVETPGDSEAGDASADEETDDEDRESDDSEDVSGENESDGVEENDGTGEAEEGEPSDVEPEEPEEGEASDTEQEEPSDTQQEDRKESGNTDADAETGDGQDTQPENGGESGGPDESNKTDSGDAADTANQETHTVSMPEYYAEHVISIQTLENTPAKEEKEPQTEEREETQTEEKREPEKKEQEVTVTISDVSWQADPAYDGSAEGTYIFTAVLPEGYALAEGVSLPEITVTVGTTDAAIQALLARIAALPDAEEYLAAEPDSDDYGDDEDGYEEAYTEWMEGLYSYAGEALAIWEEIEELPEKEQALIPQEAADKLAAWVEIANAAQESTQVMAAAGEHTNHTGWTKLTSNMTTLTAGGNYYLDTDVEVSSELKVTGGTVTLCLNGHTLTRRSADAKNWIITVGSGATLNVYDCAGGGMMEATSKGGGISTAGTLNVYGGVISGMHSYQSKTDLTTLTYGAGICAQAGSEVNLFGGTVKGTMSSGVYVVSGGKLTVDGAQVASQFESQPEVYAASIYIEGGAEASIKSGTVSWSSDTYNSSTIFVSPGGSLSVSGGTVSEEENQIGGIALGKHSYHTSSDSAHAVISGGTVSTAISARSGMSVTISGGHVTKAVVLYGGVLELSGNQDIQGDAGTDIIIGIDRANSAVVQNATGKIKLTGALTNTKPYMVYLRDLSPSSAYPLTITEGFDSCMSGSDPTNYFASKDGYKIVLREGEVTFVPYVMTFDANGGACETKTGDINGGRKMRNLPEPTREHYAFDGWYTQKDGGDKITIDAMPSGKDMTVYAHWTPVDYAITYDLADGALQNGESNPASYHIETPAFTLKNPVRAGYVFTGWSGTGLTGEANKTVTVPKGSTGERAYTAHWEEARYKVTVSTYKDGALWSSGAPAVKLTADNGSSFVTDLTAVGNGSYRIYSGNFDTGVTVTVGGADAAARVDYYTLSFYDRNSELTQMRQTVLKDKKAQKPSAPARTGYLFAGWCDNANLTGTPVTEISAPITAKQTFYAKWTAAEYQVTFEYQKATSGNTVGNMTVTYDAAYGELPAPTKTGYVFKGWYTSENGQGDPVMAETIVQTASAHTLYAYWKDETPPDQPVLQNGVTLPADWTNTQTTIPLKLYDGVGVTGLQVSVDENPYVEISGFSGGTGSVNYSYTVQSGEHKYQFKAVDAAGNTSAESAIFTVKLDQTKPKIGTITYENKAANLWQWIIGKTSLIIHVPVTDTGSGVTGISFCLTSTDAAGNPDSGNAVTDTATVSGGEAKITFDADFRGTIAINCTDAAGNAADSVTIGADAGGVIVEDKAPDITIQADRNPSDIQQTQPDGAAVADGYYDTAPALLVKVKDDTDNAVTGGLASVTYQVGDGAEKPVTVDRSTLQKAAQAAFTIPASEIPTGITKIEVTATDNAGNEAAESITVKVKGPEKTPGAEIDYWEEELKNLVPGEKYTIDGMEYTADGEGRISLIEDWLGTTVSIVKKGNGNETTDSLAQSLPVPTRPAKPTPKGIDVSTAGGTGKLTGLTAGVAYEVSADGGSTWLSRTADGSGQIAELAPGTYVVRIKAGTSSFASENSDRAEIGAYQVKVTFMANGENYREIFVDHGGTLTDIPAVPPKRDAGDQTYTSEWCSDQQGTPAVFTNLTADMTVYAVYMSTYTVALQGGTGYTLSAQAGSTSPVKEGGSFTFGFALSNGYQKTAGFAVKVNGVKAELTADGTYTISDIRENKTVTVEGVAKKPGKPSDPDGDKDKEDDSKSESEDPTPQPEDSESHNPAPKPPVTLPGKGKGSTPGTTSPAEADWPAPEQKKPETGSNSGQEPEAQPTRGQTQEPKKQEESENQNTAANSGNQNRQGTTVADNGGQPDGGTVRSVTAETDQGRIVISGESISTGNVAGMEQTSTEMALGNGAVFVTVVCEDEKYAAGVKDTAAVANAVLSAEQIQLVNDGEAIEIRVDVKDISEKVPQKDKEIIENGLTGYREEIPALTLGRYVDISMFMRIGESDWDAITSTEEPIEVVIGVPEDMREDGREFYIIRAHEGEHTFMRDLDEEPDTITISTDMFSSYAIAYAAAGSGNGENVCSLCHICPTFLSVCCFIWLAVVIVVILFAAGVSLRREKGK